MDLLDWILAIPKAIASYALSFVVGVLLIAIFIFLIYIINLPFSFIEKIKNRPKSAKALNVKNTNSRGRPMFCKNCELSSHREKNNIEKRHCKKCMSSYYMGQAEAYIDSKLDQYTPNDVKALNYDEVQKAASREVQLFTKRKTYFATEIINSSVAKEIISNPNVIKANKVIEDNLEVVNLSNISCVVKNRKNRSLYNVTLNNCTCTDYKIHKRPCKHMYRLAMAIGLMDPPNKVNKK